ncbi:MAG TPA: Rap1a/Tai family immunity protein [Rhizomicrobium sp.]|jgi:hypothetical protein|nr:Rap1a/Tai family immunity protein [Rhizomicrobium sp.]
MKALMIAALLCCVATAAQAETALALRERCTGMTGIANAGMCKSSVGGIVDDFKADPAYCVPKDAERAQTLAIVQKYLTDHPEDMHLTSTEVIGKAMAAAYPCPAKP